MHCRPLALRHSPFPQGAEEISQRGNLEPRRVRTAWKAVVICDETVITLKCVRIKAPKIFSQTLDFSTSGKYPSDTIKSDTLRAPARWIRNTPTCSKNHANSQKTPRWLENWRRTKGCKTQPRNQVAQPKSYINKVKSSETPHRSPYKRFRDFHAAFPRFALRRITTV